MLLAITSYLIKDDLNLKFFQVKDEAKIEVIKVEEQIIHKDANPSIKDEDWETINNRISDFKEEITETIEEKISDFENKTDQIELIEEVIINPSEQIIEDIIKIIDEKKKEFEEYVITPDTHNHAEEAEDNDELIESIFFFAMKVILTLIIGAGAWLMILLRSTNKKEAELFPK